MTSPWFVRARPRPNARVRLVCFAYAGVGASVYSRWTDHLRNDVDVWAVQLPGRESRLRDTPSSDLLYLAGEITREIDRLISAPVALFGHSMGSVLAYETACMLAARGREPIHLFVSGRRPPHVPDPDAPLRHLTDAEFVRAIDQRYGGIPAQILAEQELLDLLLPALRADITALEQHPVALAAPLTCPVTAYGGTDDPRTPRAHLDAWRAATSGSFRIRTFAGKHFYLTEQREVLAADIAASLAPAIDRSMSEVSA